MRKKFPDKQFDEKAFEKGFSFMDVDKDGSIDKLDIRLLVLKKVKSENLYIGK